jgi:hypothetical protein
VLVYRASNRLSVDGGFQAGMKLQVDVGDRNKDKRKCYEGLWEIRRGVVSIPPCGIFAGTAD